VLSYAEAVLSSLLVDSSFVAVLQHISHLTLSLSAVFVTDLSESGLIMFLRFLARVVTPLPSIAKYSH
jgi:hypothetical protein